MKKDLQFLGLNEKESVVFECLALFGPQNPTKLSERLAIKRTTTQSTLSTLSEKKLLLSEKRGRTTYYSIRSPDSLVALIEEEKKKVLDKEKKIGVLKDKLEMLIDKNLRIVPTVSIALGDNEVKRTLKSVRDDLA